MARAKGFCIRKPLNFRPKFHRSIVWVRFTRVLLSSLNHGNRDTSHAKKRSTYKTSRLLRSWAPLAERLFPPLRSDLRLSLNMLPCGSSKPSLGLVGQARNRLTLAQMLGLPVVYLRSSGALGLALCHAPLGCRIDSLFKPKLSCDRITQTGVEGELDRSIRIR